jgi:hypothetical protein
MRNSAMRYLRNQSVAKAGGCGRIAPESLHALWVDNELRRRNALGTYYPKVTPGWRQNTATDCTGSVVDSRAMAQNGRL